MHNLLFNIDKSFPDVKQIDCEELNKLMKSPKELILLDVRTPQEYAVSHLQTAERIAPLEEWNSQTLQTFMLSRNLKNKTIVFYCSVGYRSSQLASHLRKPLEKLEIKDAYNLRGGIFAWHNQSRPLFSLNGSTKLIHPFNNAYKKFVTNSDLASYQIENP